MDWNVVAGIVSALAGVLGLMGVVFHRAVIQPLADGINDFRSLLKELQYDLQKTEEKRQEMDKRLVAVEQSTRAAHHRIDSLERG